MRQADQKSDLSADHLSAVTRPDPVSLQLEQSHKQLTNKFVIPVLGFMTLAFYLALFRPTTPYFVISVVGIIVAGLNAWLGGKERIFRLGSRTFSTRSDRFDCVRWLVTLIGFDVPLMLIIEIPPPAFLVCWTMLLLAAQADLYHGKYRTLVIGAGFIAGALIYFKISNSESVTISVLTLMAMLAILLFFDRMESYWTREVKFRQEVEHKAAEERLRVELMERDALLGSQSRMISHEIANLIMVADMTISNPNRMDMERFRRSLQFIKKINSLVLDDLNRGARTREYNIAELLLDLELIVRKSITTRGINWSVIAGDDVSSLRVKERSGSLFLILLNLIKNAAEALKDARPSGSEGQITVRVIRVEDFVHLSVIDNGSGIDEKQVAQLLAGSSNTSKDYGHGLGFRFIHSECEKNNFDIEIRSTPGAGTEITVAAPIAWPGKEEPDTDMRTA